MYAVLAGFPTCDEEIEAERENESEERNESERETKSEKEVAKEMVGGCFKTLNINTRGG